MTALLTWSLVAVIATAIVWRGRGLLEPTMAAIYPPGPTRAAPSTAR